MKSFTDKQLKDRKEAVKKAAAVLRRVISVLEQPCFVQFSDKDTEEFQISELNAVLEVLEAAPPGSPDESAILITHGELKEHIIEELKESKKILPPDGVIEDLVKKLAEHFNNDLSQWETDNLKDFFNRDDVRKVVEV